MIEIIEKEQGNVNLWRKISEILGILGSFHPPRRASVQGTRQGHPHRRGLKEKGGKKQDIVPM
jgi:hypothetical protein